MSQKTSRRDLLKRTLIVLGAAALVQPSGGVLGFAQIKKEDNKQPGATSGTANGKKGKGKQAKGPKPKDDRPFFLRHRPQNHMINAGGYLGVFWRASNHALFDRSVDVQPTTPGWR